MPLLPGQDQSETTKPTASDDMGQENEVAPVTAYAEV